MNVNFGTVPFLVTVQECSLVVEKICHQFSAAGLQTVCTFDLKTTLPPGEICECQMVVLLVYGKEGPPFSLSIYGEPDHTMVMLQDSHLEREKVANLVSGVLSGNV